MSRDSASPDKPIFTEWFVDMSKPGIKVNKLEKLGLRMDSCCEITFDNVELEEKDMFGREGNGFNRVKEEFDRSLCQPTSAIWRSYRPFPTYSRKIRSYGDQTQFNAQHVI